MEKFHMIDKRERNVREELKEYTIDELKLFFEPNKSDFFDEWEKWNVIEDILDLEEYLRYVADGMEVPYSFEKVKQS